MADESSSANRSARRRGSLPYMQETMNLTATWISGIGAIIFVSLFLYRFTDDELSVSE